MMKEIREKLGDKCVGIAGCGGLGSNCAAALARTGIGHLVIVDFDTVNEPNLNRQFFFIDQVGQKKVFALQENLQKITKQTKITALDMKLDARSVLEVFNDCDVIVEAFDLAEMKHMIIETVLEHFPEKFLVTGIGLAGWGNSNDLKVRKTGKLIICGDETKEVSDELPPLAPRVGIVAHTQANEVLEILLKSD